MNCFDEKIQSLRWHRLRCTLRNIRMSLSARADSLTVIHAIIEGVCAQAGGYDASAIIFHIKEKPFHYKIREGDCIALEIFFFRRDNTFVNAWRQAFISYLADPATGRNFKIIECGDAEERSISLVAAEAGNMPEEGELCLEFLTPVPCKTEKKILLAKDEFISLFEKRFSRLFGIPIAYKSGQDDFSLLPFYWQYKEPSRESKSQPGNKQYINGCFGKLYIKGRFGNLLPFLFLGSEIHAGEKPSFARGYYLLHGSSAPFFAGFYPRKKVLADVIRSVLNRYDRDHIAEICADTETLSLNPDDLAEVIHTEIKNGAYTPAPNTAFLIEKKGKLKRQLERLTFKDLVVQQYILKTLSFVFDLMFEEESIGFRKNISREKAMSLVKSAVDEGYVYVIESDIEDFFPSVDLDILERLLDFCLPQQDKDLKAILHKIIRNGCILDGIHYPRTKGLPQGAPLSPLFSNLYLDSFDEHVRTLNVKLIRYADDFLILTRSREEALNVLSDTESFLAHIGLKLKKEKTSIHNIDEGFHFLGMAFMGKEVQEMDEDAVRQFRKPLYLTEPYLFLASNGDAIDIRKNRQIIETIPLRRISEIMVMEKASFSTTLLKRCVDFNIPFTVVLNTGYRVATVKPDYRKYFDVGFEHASRYYELSDTERLAIAKDFAAVKIKNYIAFFKQRYIPELNLFIGELRRTTNNIYNASDVNQVRGYEGAAAKKIFQQLNLYIADDFFHIKGRTRVNPDPINSLLNFGYYLLFSRINVTLRTMGLNPYLGFLHSPDNTYESLAYDIEELFRSRIDRLIIRMLNLKIIKADDFDKVENGYHLKQQGRHNFLNQFEGEMQRTNAKNTLSLQQNIYFQALQMKKFVLENGTLSFKEWRT